MRSPILLALALSCLGFLGSPRLLSTARAQPTEASPSREIAEVIPGEPRYLGAMRTELAAMRLSDVECAVIDATRGTCSFSARGVATDRELTVRMVYSDVTDTVYVFIDHYLVAPDGAPSTPRVLRRLMELNWSLLLARFEWSPTDGNVRLAMVLNTDSNFDRRAFRAAARGIVQLADFYYAGLERVTHTPE